MRHRRSNDRATFVEIARALGDPCPASQGRTRARIAYEDVMTKLARIALSNVSGCDHIVSDERALRQIALSPEFEETVEAAIMSSSIEYSR